MDGVLGVVRYICRLSSARLSRLVGIFSCLDEKNSGRGVHPGGRGVNGIACHLVSISVARGAEVDKLCVGLFRCSSDSALGVRVIRLVGVCGSGEMFFWRVVGILPAS